MMAAEANKGWGKKDVASTGGRGIEILAEILIKR